MLMKCFKASADWSVLSPFRFFRSRCLCVDTDLLFSQPKLHGLPPRADEHQNKLSQFSQDFRMMPCPKNPKTNLGRDYGKSSNVLSTEVQAIGALCMK